MNIKRIIMIICVLASIVKAQHNETEIDFYHQLSKELETKLNEKVNYLDLVNIDSAKVDLGSWYFFSDPYGTLKGCILFEVNTYDLKNNIGKNYFGVYKDSKIIYITSSLVNSYFNPEIIGSEDLNNDGRVEIIYSLLYGNRWGLQYVWIGSWDGNKLEFLNETDPNNENNSKIFFGEGTFETIDIEGDGILEIKGEDQNFNLYKWNGAKYVMTSSDFKEGLLPRDKVDVELNCKVKKTDTGFNYSYTIYNKPTSIQRIEQFWLDSYISKRKMSNYKLANKWEHLTEIYEDTTGIVSNSLLYDIKKNEKKRILSYDVVICVPRIIKTYIGGRNGKTNYYDYPYNSYQTYSIGPKEINDTLSNIKFLDTLKTYCDSSYNFGWIKDETIKTKYENYLNSAKMNLEKDEGTKAKSELNKFLTDLKADSLNYLTDEAYALLRYNTEYLLTKIKEGGSNIENKLSGGVNIVITQTDSLTNFSYSIANNDTSSQAIKNIYVTNTGLVTSVNLPSGWTNINGVDKYNLIGFNSQSDGILSGAELSGFEITTNGLPTIGKIYLQSGRSAIDSSDIYGNSYVVETLVPTQKHAEFNAVKFVDTLIYYNNKSLSNNWLSAEWVKNVIENSLNNAKMFTGKKLYTSAIPVIQQLISILDSYKTSGFIKDEAYFLLKINSRYLIEKLNSLAVKLPKEALAQLDLIIEANLSNKTNSLYSADWIFNTLESILNNAKITLNQNNKAGCKSIIEQFIATIDSYKTSGFITAEGLNNMKPKCLTLIEMLK